MERGEGLGRVSFDLDHVFALLTQGVDFVMRLFRPTMDFIRELSGAGWLGAAVVFSIFFSVFLIRAGARSGLGNVGAFGAALEYYAGWGLLASGGFLLLLGLEWAFMPLVTVLVSAVANSLNGDEPGFLQMLAFIASPTPDRKRFLNDMATFYGEAHTVLPLGFRSVGFVLVAFGTMWLVARGMGRMQTR